MTGKELALVFAGATLLASGATAATQLALHDSSPREVVADTSALEARLEQMERDQSRTTKALERLSGTMDRLTEQLASVRTEVAEATRAAEAASSPFASFDSDDDTGSPRIRMLGGPGRIGMAKLDELSDEERAEVLAKMGQLPHLIDGAGIALDGEELPEALRGALGAALGESLGLDGESPFGGLMKGMELRRLPEADRWQKAQETLNLTGRQVEDLKSATKALDEEMKGAMVEESRTTDGGAQLTIRRTDPVKASEARKRYQESVDATLDTEQRKKWKSEGYSNAFGRAGGGTGTAISVMSVNTLGTGVTPESTKSDE